MADERQPRTPKQAGSALGGVEDRHHRCQNELVSRLIFITHPEVVVDPVVPVTQWRLSEAGIRRMRLFSASELVAGVSAVWASTEVKAIEAAGILAARLGQAVQFAEELGENDRSSTGFLPPAEFEGMADAFFAEPHTRVRGWETAANAQRRIRTTVDRILTTHRSGDLAIVAHGAVGTLLLCSYRGQPISRSADQPFQGHYWTASLHDPIVEHGWRPIAPRA